MKQLLSISRIAFKQQKGRSIQGGSYVNNIYTFGRQFYRHKTSTFRGLEPLLRGQLLPWVSFPRYGCGSNPFTHVRTYSGWIGSRSLGVRAFDPWPSRFGGFVSGEEADPNFDHVEGDASTATPLVLAMRKTFEGRWAEYLFGFKLPHRRLSFQPAFLSCLAEKVDSFRRVIIFTSALYCFYTSTLMLPP